jgi:copper(I)-binding protein
MRILLFTAFICAIIWSSYAEELADNPASTDKAAITEEAGQAPTINITHSWAKPTLGSHGVSVAYAHITNTLEENDRLIKASTPITKRAELHTHTMQHDIMTMRKIEQVDIPAGETVELKPGSYHIMLFGIDEKLSPGDSFPITFHFENAGEIVHMFTVKEIGRGHHH